MRKFSLTLIYKTLLISCLLTTFSCKKFFELDPVDQVGVTNHYRDVYDANAAVIGIYGQLMGLAGQYIVLNELRADLMSPTSNADKWLKQLNTHTVTADNPWADPKPFFKVILNCNDAMAHFDTMLKEDKLNSSDYQQRISDVGAVRAWVYLQLGIHFGSVPYVTDPLATIEDLKDTAKYPRVSLNQLLDNLIAFMGDSQRYLDTYPATATVTGSSNTSLNTNISGYGGTSYLFFINKRILLGDLYLWRGQYANAAAMYKYVSDIEFTLNTNAGDQHRYQRYKATNYDNANTIAYGGAAGTNENALIYGPTKGWASMFMSTTVGAPQTWEWLWSMVFDKNYLPVNPFIDLFSNQGGKYLLTASQLSMDMWNSETQRNGLPYDARGHISVRTINGQPVIAKQLYTYLDINTLLPTNLLEKDGRWTIYRTGYLGLRLAEAACADNQVKVAYALVNVGFREVFSDSAVPSTTTLPAPYNFMARQSGPQGLEAWYNQTGTRTRANLPPLPTALYENNDRIGMENAIIAEDAAERAFEGDRWGDLLRVSLRRNDPSFLADKVYEKLLRDGNPAAATVRAKLMSSDGLYLPFNL